jgi:hypothetical protein
VEKWLPVRITTSQRNITPLDEVLMALQFYATGTFQSVVGNVLKVSKASVCRSIHNVSFGLCKIAGEHITYDVNLLQVLPYIMVFSLNELSCISDR